MFLQVERHIFLSAVSTMRVIRSMLKAADACSLWQCCSLSRLVDVDDPNITPDLIMRMQL